MKLIDKHFEWMKKKRLIGCKGLCRFFKGTIYKETFYLFKPTKRNEQTLFRENAPLAYWGAEKYIHQQRIYTPRRQTIVLFICAMHNEL